MKNDKQTAKSSLIEILAPLPNSTIMIYDVHASESGALSILDDLYQQVRAYSDKSVTWIFVVSTPEYKETSNIHVKRFPWVKRNWGYRYYFEFVITRLLIKKLKPDKIFSLQNKGISFYKGEELVYLHLPFVLTEHKFKIKNDGLKLWLYQNIMSRMIFHSLQKVSLTIVQTQWMKSALIDKAELDTEKVVVLQPDISCNNIRQYIDIPENRKRFFYPATAFTYKNHMTLLKALNHAQLKGMKKYEMILTIEGNENGYAKQLKKYAEEHKLNVKFKGKISREEVFELYAMSTLIFPSYVESFGLPLLEARMSGSYIIASNCTFCREILEGYNRVKFFSEFEYKALGNLIYDSCDI